MYFNNILYVYALLRNRCTLRLFDKFHESYLKLHLPSRAPSP